VTTPQPTTVLETVTTVVDATVTVTDVSVSVAEATVVQTQTQTVAPETRPYDNGMWHTTYYYTVTPVETSAAAPTETTWVDADLPKTSAAPTPSVDNGAWAPPAGVDDGSWERWEGKSGGWSGQKS
jgi:hypothetical protein